MYCIVQYNARPGGSCSRPGLALGAAGGGGRPIIMKISQMIYSPRLSGPLFGKSTCVQAATKSATFLPLLVDFCQLQPNPACWPQFYAGEKAH
jgi:hypothetical protein